MANDFPVIPLRIFVNININAVNNNNKNGTNDLCDHTKVHLAV